MLRCENFCETCAAPRVTGCAHYPVVEPENNIVTQEQADKDVKTVLTWGLGAFAVMVLIALLNNPASLSNTSSNSTSSNTFHCESVRERLREVRGDGRAHNWLRQQALACEAAALK